MLIVQCEEIVILLYVSIGYLKNYTMGKTEHSEGSRRPSGYQQRRLDEPQKKNTWTAPPAGVC